MLLGVVVSGNGLAQTPVQIDDWFTGSTVNAEQVGQPTDTAGRTAQAATTSIIGGFRNVYAQADNGGQVSFVGVAGERVAEYANSANSAGLVRLIWDGQALFPIDPVVQEIDVVDPVDFSNLLLGVPSPPGSGNPDYFNPRGLGGVDIRPDCPVAAEAGITILLSATDVGTTTVTLDVFTDELNWSRASFVQDFSADAIVPFLFDSDFTAQGSNGGANFDSVGAIVLSFDTDVDALDVDFGTPLVSGCGIDFGDAPDNAVFDGSGANPTYRTLARFLENSLLFGTTRVNNQDPEFGSFRGPHHLIGGPFLGRLSGNTTDPEIDGQPSPTAAGDDGAGSTPDDEQALSTPPVFFADFVVLGNVQPQPDPINDPPPEFAECAGVIMGENEYCVELEVSNPTDRWAQVVGWIDFRGSGSFDNLCGDNNTSGFVEYGANPSSPGTDLFCERSASRVLVGGTGFISTDGGSSCAPAFTNLGLGDPVDEGAAGWADGNIPPGCEGTVVLTWDLQGIIDAESDPGLTEPAPILTTEDTFARFRISTDPFESGSTGCGFFQSTGPTPFCYASDGEVEDHLVTAGTLPVSIASFESRFTDEGLEVSWTTASETENSGFHIWGDTGSDIQNLTASMVPSTADDISAPQSYQVVLSGVQPGAFEGLAVTAVDTRGQEEMYGFFDIGTSHGRDSAVDVVDWRSITQEANSRMARMGIGETAGVLSRQTLGEILAADFVVAEPGMQRITYEDLAAAGLDLAGANPFTIAVSVNGKAVPRVVTLPEQGRFNIGRFTRGSGSRPPRFGPGSAIEFWGEQPGLPDALYVENLVYRVSIDAGRAVEAENFLIRPRSSLPTQPQTVRVAEFNGYNPFNLNPHPFFAKRLYANTANDSHTLTLDVDDFADLSQPARIQVRIAGETDYPIGPDHHVRIQINGQTVHDDFFDGQISKLVEAEIPAGVLQVGENSVTVIAAGETSAPADQMFLGEVAVTYQRSPVAVNDALLVEGLDAEVNAVRVEGLSNDGNVVGFGWDGERLFQMSPRASGRGNHSIATLGKAGAQYWLSTGDALHVPQAIGTVGANTVMDQLESGDPIDFIVIAHPAFMPLSDFEAHPLNDYLAQRRGEGWNVALFDVLDIQQHFGGGMPVPGAVTEFLRAADERLDFEHVLLVGDGNYDHLDYLGLGGISFIPTVYQATSRIRHTPSDALLSDLDGDGLSDKAVGRWPVRTLDDLRATVTKTFDWQNNAEEIQGAIWLTDRQDPSVSSFEAQTLRMSAPLVTAGWPEDRIDQVIFEDVGGAANARALLINALEEGRAVTGFSGHAAPTMWTWEGLLVSSDVRHIDNRGRPTLIGTMSCYTSYSVSPRTNTIAHRMMNGYMVDGNGDQIPGEANGAVAIHGAATLSSLAQNEIVAKRVLENQLAGMTLGEAIEEARLNAWQRGLRDQVINWTLLGDPTLMLDR